MEYVEHRDDTLYVSASRVSLASVALAFRDGDSPETIQRNHPSLTLEQVYGAIAYYLRHLDEVHHDLESREKAREEMLAGAVSFREEMQRRKQQAATKLLKK